MSEWDVNPGEVFDVLTRTVTAGQDIITAVSGSADGASTGMGEAATGVMKYSQSGLIGTALNSFFEARHRDYKRIIDRIQGVVTATGEATNAITLGDGMMARLIHVTLEEAGVLDDYSVFLDR